MLQHCQEGPDLAGIRDKEAVAKLPAEEQAACQKLWADVAALLKTASGKPVTWGAFNLLSFPNSVWERASGNSVSGLPADDRSSRRVLMRNGVSPTGVPKRSLGTRAT
jgi:hypothetical protein